ncbi:uncharacterized protein LOC144474969 [Augochlora pura]
MEDETFRDYYKAENSDDEEANDYLQSQLYSKIYYVATDVVDEKPEFKFNFPSTENKDIVNTANTSTVDSKNEEIKNIVTDNYVTSDTALFEEDTKPNIKPICVENQSGTSVETSRDYSNVPSALQHSEENVATSQGLASQTAEITNNLDPSNISRDVCSKPKEEEKSEVELKSTNTNFEINESASQSHSKSSNANVDNRVEEIQEVNIVQLNVDQNNILKRYEFSKMFINKLYQEKYDTLQKQLQKLDKEEEMRLKIEEEESKVEFGGNQQLYASRDSISDEESDSKYNLCTKSKKRQKVNDYSEDQVILLTSDTESDSEGSILEVPIPPKPKPPVINLQDSDDSETNDTDNCSLTTKIEDKKKVSRTRLNKTSSTNDRLRINITEDIMLNCSEVQKGASSIKEIKAMSKIMQNKSKDRHDKNENDSGKDKSVSINKTCSRNVDDVRKSLSSSEKDNIPECDVSLEATSNRNIVFERDKNQSVTSMEDVTNFEIPNQPSSSRKRQRVNDDEHSTSTKQKKYMSSKDTFAAAPINEQDKHNNETVWDEYFFRPMSDKVKAFYNESRGQENFNIEEIQSKMSRDPRLWAVLDDDLIPHFAKGKRFWNLKCNNCNKEGHQTYHCPEPRKPPRCHMCGIQGHMERNCPKKMCLTCGKTQGSFRKTCEFCCTLYCDMCRSIGHESTECPDHWRRFHQTTENSEIRIPESLSEVMKPADMLFCCNCTRRGHDSSTCHDYRWSQHFPTPAFVTNYTDEPLSNRNKNATSEDIIPLKKPVSKRKERKIGVRKIPEEDELQYCFIVYKFGSFDPSRKDGQEISRLVEGEIYRTSRFVDSFDASFLEELRKTIAFELVIYHSNHQSYVRIRSTAGAPVHIYRTFDFWMRLDKRDKQSLKLYINLPYDAKKLYNMFTAKWEEMEQASIDPYALCKQIQLLQTSMSEACDPSILHNISDRICRMRGKLLYLYNKLATNSLEMLRQITKKLHKCSSKKKKRHLTDSVYCRCIHLYNDNFLPRILTGQEVNTLFQRYHKQNAQDKRKEKPKKKRQCELSPYERFILFERSAGIRNKETATSSNFISEENEEIPACTSTRIVSQEQSEKIIGCPSTENISQEPKKKIPNCTSGENVIQEQSRKIPTPIDTPNVTEIQGVNVLTCTSTKEQGKKIPVQIFTENIVQEQNKEVPIWSSPENVIYTTTENVVQKQNKNIPVWTTTGMASTSANVQCNDTFSVCSAEESNRIHPVEHVQVKNTIKQGHESNLIVIPLKKPTKSDIILQQSDNNSETNTESAKDNNIPQASTSKKGTVVFDTASQKGTGMLETVPKKKRRKRGKSENNTEVAKKEETNINMSIENRAQKVINEALQFNLPYMNNAAEEVRKRINDKTIKQEQIDVLQRLINLEKDHRQYVSSFYSYFK